MSGKNLIGILLSAMAWSGAARAAEANAIKPAAAPPPMATLPATAPAPAGANAPLQAPTDTNAVIVTVNGQSLTMGMINWLQPNAQPATIKQIADFWVTTQLLNAEAVKRNLTASPKTKFLAQLSAMQVYGREVMQQVQETAAVTEAEVSDYYNQNKDTDPRFSEPERISFTHILLKTLDEANAAQEKVKAGEDMGALARQLSKSFDAAIGGAAKNLAANFVKMRYGKEVYDVLADAKEGQLLGPVKTRDGFEVVRFDGKLPAGPKPLESVKDQIKSDLERRAKSTSADKFISSLKEKAAPDIQKSDFLIQAEKLVPPMGAPGMGPRGGAPQPLSPPSSAPSAPGPKVSVTPGAASGTQQFHRVNLDAILK